VLVLIRHGETEANARNLLVGRAESPLTELGRAQAGALAQMLGPVSRLVSSPLGRAMETARALGLPVEVEVDERWVELDYGAYDLEPLDDVPAELWRRWRHDAHFRPPGGESLAEMSGRVRAACAELFAHDGAGARGEGDVVVVSHVSPIKAAVAWALGAHDTVAWRLYLATASITVIGWGAGAPLLRRYNVTSGLAGRF
jgi:broad specificity phosphatase PhoE